MAFDDGLAAAHTRIADLPTRFAGYRPDNFDRTFRGDVTIAEALQRHPDLLAVVERHVADLTPVPDWMVARVLMSPDLRVRPSSVWLVLYTEMRTKEHRGVHTSQLKAGPSSLQQARSPLSPCAG